VAVEGDDVAIFSLGVLMGESIKAAQILEEKGISARVVNMHTLKPLDQDIIVESAKRTGAIVSAEEHNVIGGVGSAIAAVLCEKYPCHMRRIGIRDRFGKSGGGWELLDHFRLSAPHIVEACEWAIQQKKREAEPKLSDNPL